MATAESGGSAVPDPGAKNIFQGNLTALFKVGKAECEVQLDTTHLRWDKPTRKNKAKFSHSVAIADIIALTDASLGKSEKVADRFTVHYLARQKNFHWKVASVILHAKDEETTRTWIDNLRQHLQSTVAEQKRPRNVLVFINPGCGNSQGVQMYEKHSAPLFELAGIKTKVIVTERARHAVDFLQDCSLDGVDGLIAVGGDGTLNDVMTGALNHFMKEAGRDPNNYEQELVTCPIRIGTIPAGTGNGMVKLATNTYDITTATLHIVMGNSLPVNVVSAYSDGLLLRHSLIFICFGMYGEVMNHSQENRHLGKKRYLKTMLNMSKFMKFYDFDIHYIPASDIAEDSKEKPEQVEPGGWYKAPGPFANLMAMNIDFDTFEPFDGSGTVSLMTRPTMFGLFKMFYRLYNFTPHSFNFDFLKNIQVKVMKIVNGRPEEQKGAEGGATSGAATAGALTNCVCIDGEIHKMSNSPTIVKFHGTNCSLFGTAPALQERRKQVQKQESKPDTT